LTTCTCIDKKNAINSAEFVRQCLNLNAWAATLISICQSCRLVGLDVRTYLTEVFAAMHTGRKDYANLRPAAWAAQRDAAKQTG
jgi:hypothetical protein